MAARTWNCARCGKQVLPVRDAAGVIVCPRCRTPATPVAVPPQPRPVAGSKPSGLRPPAAQSDARRPARSATSSVRHSASAVARPATPSDALAQSSAWVPESDPGPSPDAIGLSATAPQSWGREHAFAPNGSAAALPRATVPAWMKSPITLAAAGAAVILLAVIVAILVRQLSTPSAPATALNLSAKTSTPSPRVANDSPQPAVNTPSTAAHDTATPASVTAATASPAITTPAPVPSRTMDLLAMLDLSRDVIVGEWRQVPGGITSDDSRYARLALPYQPPAEYDFKVEFTRTSTKEESVVQLFVLHGHACAWVMNGWQGSICAFSMINGKVGKDNGTGTRDVPVHAGERHVSIVKVRKNAIEAYLDGKLLNRHETDGSDLSLVHDWDLRGRILGIGSFQNPVVFHAVEIQEITGKGRLLVDPLTPASASVSN